jgi:RNA polymerase sigma-70 factor (ECF subfamily)
MGRIMDNLKQQAAASDQISDREIITRILQGEKELFTLLVRRYNQRMYRVGMSIVNDDAEVEDVMQVAYIRAYEKLGQFAFRSSFPTWLIKILINESLLRVKNRKLLRNMDNQALNNESPDQYGSSPKTPAANLANEELRRILEEAIRQLPEKYRTVFIMREIEQMNVEETRECLDLSESNVKIRLNRAKSLLKESLSKYYQKEDILEFHLTRCDRMVASVTRELESRGIPLSNQPY